MEQGAHRALRPFSPIRCRPPTFLLRLALYTVAIAALTRVGPARAQIFTEYVVPAAGGAPAGIAAGPDGNLWFAETSASQIGNVTTTGAFTEYAITANYVPLGITAGPDGNLWFTEYNANQIGKITTTGAITEYAIPTAGASARDITVGPDGNLWFTEQGPGQIGKITTTGAFTEYAIPTANSGPEGITVGPDGNLWFTEEFAHQIGKVTTTGAITEYAIPTANSGPIGITAGPDGNLWFTEQVTSQIGKITTTGAFTEYTIPTANSAPYFITAGPDGNLWFTECGANQIGTVTPTGAFTEYAVPTASSCPYGITVGPDGNLWFAEYSGNQIGKISPPSPTPTPFATVTPTLTATATPTATPSLDHFTCYKAGATSGSLKFPGIPNPPGVSLVDQFGSSTDAMEKPGFLCAPTNKLGEDPTAPTHPEHLGGYPIKNPVKPVFPTHITVIDQFNSGGLSVDAKKQAHLFVPTTKNLSATPPTPAAFVTDHFECYKIAVSSGTPKFVALPGVTLQDQFGSMTVIVRKPAVLCNPVDKNGEDATAPTHPNHLMCYQIKQTDTVKFAKLRGIFANNQFGPETLDAKKPALLCLPARTTP